MSTVVGEWSLLMDFYFYFKTFVKELLEFKYTYCTKIKGKRKRKVVQTVG